MDQIDMKGGSPAERVMAHRRRSRNAGIRRVEVTVPADDVGLVRGLTARLRAGGDDAAELRTLLEERVASRRAKTGAELVAFFRASPLTEVDLDLVRDRSTGRRVDL